ncbi:SphA family protein [Novosphingobium nitrogenifigens]|nr:transporter [Novosphingobium nitrogenifigens]
MTTKGQWASACLGAMAAALAVATPAMASEAGGGVYPNGAEGMLAGALPPKGLYYLGYLQYYEAGRFNDGDGNSGLLPDFKVKAEAVVTRVVWVTDKKFLGADYAMHVVVPVVNVDARIAGMSGNRSGVSDVTIDPIILGWHFRNGWHVITGLDINLPVGSYDRASIANFSRHYWNVEPIVAFAYYKKNLRLDVKMMYDINFKNTDAQINGFNPTGAGYRSGNEFHADYAASYAISPKVQLGFSGYYYKQTTGDHVDNAAAQLGIDAMHGFKGEAFAGGPSVRLGLGKVHLLTTWQHEFFANYRPQGDKFWIKAIIPIK